MIKWNCFCLYTSLYFLVSSIQSLRSVSRCLPLDTHSADKCSPRYLPIGLSTRHESPSPLHAGFLLSASFQYVAPSIMFYFLFFFSILLVHGQVTIIFVVSVGLSVCLFVQSFSQLSLIQFRSNFDICYMSGSSCVICNIGAGDP